MRIPHPFVHYRGAEKNHHALNLMNLLMKNIRVCERFEYSDAGTMTDYTGNRKGFLLLFAAQQQSR